jgi:hypothetical protein
LLVENFRHEIFRFCCYRFLYNGRPSFSWSVLDHSKPIHRAGIEFYTCIGLSTDYTHLQSNKVEIRLRTIVESLNLSIANSKDACAD